MRYYGILIISAISTISMAFLFPLSDSSLVGKREKHDDTYDEGGGSNNLVINNNFRSPQTSTAASDIIELRNVTNLTKNPRDSVYGQVAASENNVYIIWEESIPNGDGKNYDIFIKKSENAGDTFENNTETNLSNNSGFSEHPQIAAFNSNVYAVWTDNTFGNKEILFARSTDNGTTFDKGDEKVKNLSNSSADSYNQEIAAFGDSVYVVWQEKDAEGNNALLFRASENGGDTFGNTTIIAKGSNVTEDSFPKIAAYENDVYIVWSVVPPAKVDEQNSGLEAGLYFTKSLDKGKTLSNHIMKLNASDKNVGEAQIAAYENNVHVVWGGLKTTEVRNLHYAFSDNRGNSFANAIEIENDLFVNPLNVEVAAAMEDRANDDPSQQRLQEDHYYNLFVAGDIRSSENDEILLISGIGNTNATSTLSKTAAINLSNNSGTSECSSISISGNNVFVVWEDLTAGNHEIYFVKGVIKE
jgi:hypothetical protein